MSQANKQTTTINTDDLGDQLRSILKLVAEGTTQAVIEEAGEPLAALVSIEDLRRIQRDRDFQILENFAEGFRGIPVTDLEEEVSRAQREVRSENTLSD